MISIVVSRRNQEKDDMLTWQAKDKARSNETNIDSRFTVKKKKHRNNGVIKARTVQVLVARQPNYYEVTWMTEMGIGLWGDQLWGTRAEMPSQLLALGAQRCRTLRANTGQIITASHGLVECGVDASTTVCPC